MPSYKGKDVSTELQNFCITPCGEIRRIELNANAVLIHLIEAEDDEDGHRQYMRVVSISCVDPEMLEPLKQEARRILNNMTEK